MNQPVNILLKDCVIDKSRHNTITKEAQKRLKESISKDGLIEPILVYFNGLKFRVLSGRERVIACRNLGWLSIMATVIDKPENPEIYSIIQSTPHNELSRKDYKKIIQSLIKRGLTIKYIAQTIGCSTSTVYRWLK